MKRLREMIFDDSSSEEEEEEYDNDLEIADHDLARRNSVSILGLQFNRLYINRDRTECHTKIMGDFLLLDNDSSMRDFSWPGFMVELDDGMLGMVQLGDLPRFTTP
jgi:hypothetical protein